MWSYNQQDHLVYVLGYLAKARIVDTASSDPMTNKIIYIYMRECSQGVMKKVQDYSLEVNEFSLQLSLNSWADLKFWI